MYGTTNKVFTTTTEMMYDLAFVLSFQLNSLSKRAWGMSARDPTQDGCIKKILKQKWSSGLFWAVGAAEKKTTPNCHK